MSTVKINDQELRSRDLKNKKIALLATDGFEKSELTEPLRALREMGAEVHVVSPPETQKDGSIRGWNHTDWGVIEGRSLTSFSSIKNDLKNAGARWEDREVVCDQGLVTSRTPGDLPAFVDKFAEEVVEGAHTKQMTA